MSKHQERVNGLKSEGFTEDHLCDRLNNRNAHEHFRVMKSPEGEYFGVFEGHHQKLQGCLGELLIKYTTFKEGIPMGYEVQEG